MDTRAASEYGSVYKVGLCLCESDDLEYRLPTIDEKCDTDTLSEGECGDEFPEMHLHRTRRVADEISRYCRKKRPKCHDPESVFLYRSTYRGTLLMPSKHLIEAHEIRELVYEYA